MVDRSLYLLRCDSGRRSMQMDDIANPPVTIGWRGYFRAVLSRERDNVPNPRVTIEGNNSHR